MVSTLASFIMVACEEKRGKGRGELVLKSGGVLSRLGEASP
jgi:hypothetical protein